MVRLEPSGERIDDPLPESNDRIRALDVLDEHQTAAGSQHSVGLRYRAAIIRDRAQRQGEHSRIETLIFELQRLGIADKEPDLATQRQCSSPSQLQHLGTQVDPTQPDVGSVESQIELRCLPPISSTSPVAREQTHARASANSRRSIRAILRSYLGAKPE